MKSISLIVALVLGLSCASAVGQSGRPTKCEANINGFKIHTIYIVGDQYNGVVWAYKHIAEETCLIPTTDLSKADAILDVRPIMASGSPTVTDDTTPVSVSCSSTASSSHCSDSTGNVMEVDCSGGNCSSYYGPDPASSLAGAFKAWLYSRWWDSDASIYTVDHKLLWKSENQKGDWLGAGWIDMVRLGTNSPVCKVGYTQRSKYKNYRHWASTHCGVEFDPLVSIDLNLRDHKSAKQASQDEKAAMIQNAKDAAAKQP